MRILIIEEADRINRCPCTVILILCFKISFNIKHKIDSCFSDCIIDVFTFIFADNVATCLCMPTSSFVTSIFYILSYSAYATGKSSTL